MEADIERWLKPTVSGSEALVAVRNRETAHVD
jgi:hypothetical protein